MIDTSSNDLPSFDLVALHAALDRARVERGMSWAAIGRRIGVAPSTIQRTVSAVDMEADGVLAMIGWLGVEPERFMRAADVIGQLLPEPGGGMVRADSSAMAATSGRKAARGARRTSIQALAGAAVQSGRPIASFTRRTEV